MTGADSVKADCSEIMADIKILSTQLTDIKTMLLGSEERIRCLERAGDKTTPLVVKQISDLEEKTDDHETQLKALRELIAATANNVDKLSISFEGMQRIWKWALGVFTAMLIAILIMLVTGQAEVIFK